MSPIHYQMVKFKHELEQILKLQEKNHFSTLSAEAKADQGFLTVKHSLVQLQSMAAISPQFIATCNGEVVAYVLSMHYEMKATVPSLAPLFEELDQFSYQNTPLSKHPFIICGQTCVSNEFRGMGIMQKLYNLMRSELQAKYTGCITEISDLNQLSLRAHSKVGFETIHRYNDGKQWWHIVVWKW